jgi:hypothetical protein
MRKPVITKLDFSKKDANNFSEAIGITGDQGQSVMENIDETFHSSEKFSDFVEKLNTDYTREELSVAVVQLIRKLHENPLAQLFGGMGGHE